MILWDDSFCTYGHVRMLRLLLHWIESLLHWVRVHYGSWCWYGGLLLLLMLLLWYIANRCFRVHLVSLLLLLVLNKIHW